MSGDQLTVEEKSLLRYISAHGLTRLEPMVTPDGIKYKNLKTAEEWEQILFVLKSLANKKNLEEEDIDRAIFCPTCDSPHVYSKYACPTDKSIFVKKITLLQHEKDGYMARKEAFKKGDRLICPQCGEDLGQAHEGGKRHKSLKEIGYSFECEKSGHHFESPLVLHFCPDCGSMFDYKTARYVPLFAYSMTKKTEKYLLENLNVEKKLFPLTQLLKSEGFEVFYNVEINGVSGSKHVFGLTAVRNNSTILFDYGLGDSDILVSLLGKKMDLPGREAVLIDFSDDSELKTLSKVYNIPILEIDKEGWDEVIKDIISNLKNPPEKILEHRRVRRRKNE